MNAKTKVKFGDVYGHLTIVQETSPSKLPCGQSVRKFITLCSCGNLHTVSLRHMSSGNTVSCGCFKAIASTTHGKSDTDTYDVWGNMLKRCTNPKDTNYPHYGGRGIGVCDRWLSFENFLEDMGERPSHLTLDRINVDMGYCPENCRWADRVLQSFNKRRSKHNSSGRTGVSLDSRSQKWRAAICKDRRQIHLGLFESIEDAIRAREDAEMKYYGFTKQ